MPQNLSSVVLLLTLAHAGGAEDYCNHSVSLSVAKIPANLHVCKTMHQLFENTTSRLEVCSLLQNTNFLVSLLYQ